MTNLEKNHQAFCNLKKPKAIIFDCDNTLMNTWPLFHLSAVASRLKPNRLKALAPKTSYFLTFSLL